MEHAKTGILVDFEVTGARFRREDQAGRFALSQIAPKLAGASDEEGIAESQLALTEAWRKRVRGLYRGGWKYPADTGNWNYVMNCPPTGVVTKQTRLRTCQKLHVCPFCWVRRHVHEAYRRLEFFYYGGDRTVRLAKGGKRAPVEPRSNHLLEVHWGTDYLCDEYALWQIFEREITDGRRFLVDRIAPAGAYQLICVLPPDPRKKLRYWSTDVRMLAVMPERGFDTPDFHNAEQVQHHPVVSRDILVAAIGRACSYPSQLFRGPAVETAELLNYLDGYGRDGRKLKTEKGGSQVKGFRLSSTYGVLRNGSQIRNSQRLEEL